MEYASREAALYSDSTNSFLSTTYLLHYPSWCLRVLVVIF